MKKFLIGLFVFLFLMTSSVLAFTPDDNTTFYVTFDECVGDDLTDSSIYGLEGELVGSPTWLTPSSCVNSCCLSFDGVNDNAYFSDADNLDQAGDFTIGLWVRDYDNGTAESRRVFVGKDYEADASTPNYEMYFSPAGETVTLAYRTGTTLKSGQATLTNSNEWVCLVGSKNATHINMFVDGVLSSSTANVGVPNVNARNFRIGTNMTGGFYHVVVDELVLENISVNATWASNFCDVDQLSCDNKCTDWVATSNCTNGKQQYIRTCPDNIECDLEYWNSTLGCEREFNRTQGIYLPQFEWFYNDTWCDSEWMDIDQQAECLLPAIRIPPDCTNITVIVSSVAGYQGSDKDTGEFVLESCTPNYDCDDRTVSCDLISEGNESYLVKTDNTTYLAGETATAKVTLTTDLSCGKSWWLGAGVTSHKVAGALGVSCLKVCDTEWTCIDSYEGYSRVDCSRTNITYCTNGCASNGRCAGASATPSSDLAFGWLLNPSPEAKGILAGTIAMFIAIVSFAITKFQHPIVFTIGFGIGWVIFTLLGWIPPILTIIIIVFGAVGLYFKMNK